MDGEITIKIREEYDCFTNIWLVVWNIYYFSIQLGISYSQNLPVLTNSRNIIFQRARLKPPGPNQGQPPTTNHQDRKTIEKLN